MLGTAAWAIMNAFIIGAVWIGIVLWNRQKRLDGQQARLENDILRRQQELEQMHGRLAELEERLDLSERLLARERQPAPRSGN